MIPEIILGVSAVLFIISITILLVARRRLLTYTRTLSDSLDALLSGSSELHFEEEEDTLIGKVQMKMHRLYELMQERASINQADRMLLESNIADLSHQIKTPIASIHMYHDLLQKKSLEEERKQEFLESLGVQVDKLEFLIQSMIKMSRFETGIVKVQAKEESVYGLLAQVVCDAAPKAEKKGIDLEVHCEEGLQAYFDYKWTLEAVFNVLDNAVKYTEENGRVEIHANATDFFVRIKIIDSGKGIPEEHITEIFKRFYREPEVSRTEGVGIGLYIAREILSKQQGFIDVRSKVGIGSAFSIHLPLTNE